MTIDINKLRHKILKTNRYDCPQQTVTVYLQKKQLPIIQFLIEQGYGENRSDFCKNAVELLIKEIKLRKAMDDILLEVINGDED